MSNNKEDFVIPHDSKVPFSQKIYRWLMGDFVIPHEPKVWVFALMLRISNWRILRQIKLFFWLFFVDLAPEMPDSLSKNINKKPGFKVAIQGFVVTFLFCFAVTGVLTYLNGTFSGNDPNRIYFIQDTANLILFALICPLYVGLGCWLVVTVVSGWEEIRRYSEEIAEISSTDNANDYSILKDEWTIKPPALAIVILGIAFFAISNYINDIMAVENVEKHYWFVEYSASGGRSLGTLGVYYFLLNFVLLVMTLISITFFMSIFSLMMDIGNSLSRKRMKVKEDFRALKTKLEMFTQTYHLAKWLTVMYMINIYLWKSTPLGKTTNLVIAAFFISLIGVFFVSIPRYFVELQWHHYKYRTKQIDEDSEEYDDLRPFKVKLLVNFLDSLLIGGFLLSFLSEILLPYFKK